MNSSWHQSDQVLLVGVSAVGNDQVRNLVMRSVVRNVERGVACNFWSWTDDWIAFAGASSRNLQVRNSLLSQGQ